MSKIAASPLRCQAIIAELMTVMKMSQAVCSTCSGVLTLKTVPWYARSGSVSVYPSVPGQVSGVARRFHRQN
jgi:hypothetical protein